MVAAFCLSGRRAHLPFVSGCRPPPFGAQQAHKDTALGLVHQYNTRALGITPNVMKGHCRVQALLLVVERELHIIKDIIDIGPCICLLKTHASMPNQHQKFRKTSTRREYTLPKIIMHIVHGISSTPCGTPRIPLA